MNAEELLGKLKQFAYRVVRLTRAFPDLPEARIIKNQLLRSSFSAAANYRSACKAYSKKSFAAKLGISFEEIDESVFWLEVINDLELVKRELLNALQEEGDQLCRILTKSVISSRNSKS